ncbi:MAG: hypothetical protein LUG60_05515 [Erysipelotrichaceae bacterium]|nr:hypothetical protein [Erysipelotrichaceae bacterium]
MVYKCISLFDLINQNVKIDDIRKILDTFSSPLNPDVENFIHTKAYDFERIGLTRTYLVYAQIENGQKFLVGIYCLGQSNVEINSKLSRNDKRMMFGTTYPLGKNVKSLLIGQLSKNYTNGNNQYITGDILMFMIFLKIKDIYKLFPSVVTHIDCIDDIHLREYYENCGFTLFDQIDNKLIYLKPTNEIYFSSNNKLSNEL